MSHRYSIVEPHPSVPVTQPYLHVGRGGAGNVTKTPSSVTRGSDASGPASRASTSSMASSTHSQRAYLSGRGGLGNVHPTSERAIFSFDEELERQLSQERHAAPVYHVGRGGAGNKTSSSSSSSANRRRSSDDAKSTKSTSSAESGADIATRNMRKGWMKLTGLGL